MKHFLLIAFSVFTLNNLIFAQQGDEQPFLQDYSSQVKSDDVDGIDLSTGTVNPGIPLLSVKLNSEYSENISLNYTKGQGIRVYDFSGVAGLGWDIKAGGVLTREVRGYTRDEKIPMQNPLAGDVDKDCGWLYNPSDVPDYNADYSLLGTTAGQAVEGSYMLNPSDPNDVPDASDVLRQFFSGIYNNGNIHHYANIDSEPDIFHFSFGNYSGKFVFDPSGTPVLIPAQDIKIEPAIGPNGSSYNGTPAWIFTTPDGQKYVFYNTDDYREKTTTKRFASTNFCYPNQTPKRTLEYYSTWHLSKIIDTHGKEMTFTYGTGYTFKVTQAQQNKYDWITGNKYLGPHASAHPEEDVDVPASNVPELNITTVKLLTLITTDAENLTFVYSNDRIDLAAPKLTNIDETGGMNKHYQFNYTYEFNDCGPNHDQICPPQDPGSSPENYFVYRPYQYLKLASLEEIPTSAQSSNPTWSFEYKPFNEYTIWHSQQTPQRYWYCRCYSNNLVRNTRNLGEDYWGFFKGLHWYISPGSQSYGDEVCITEIGPAGQLIPPGPSGSGLDGTNRNPDEEEFRIYTWDGSTYIWASNQINSSNEDSYTLSRTPYNQQGILTKITLPTGGVIDYEYETNTYYDNSSSTSKTFGGLRVKRIKTSTSAQDSPIIKEFKYTTETDPNKSSGEVVPLRRNWDNVIFCKHYDDTHISNSYSTYYFRESQSHRAQPRDLIRYTRVEVVTIGTNSTGNGKVVYKMTGYSSNPDVPCDRFEFNHINTAVTPPQVCSWTSYTDDRDNDAGAPNGDMSFERGLITKIEFYNQAQEKIKEIENEYEFAPSNFTPVEVKACKVNTKFIYNSIYSGSTPLNWSFDPPPFNVEYYKHISKWFYLKKTTERNYSMDADASINANNFLTLQTNYFYDNSVHKLVTRIEKINSDNKKTIIQYKYPQDFNVAYNTQNDVMSSCLWLLVNRHIHNIPVATHVFKELVSSTTCNNLYSSKFTILKQLSGSIIVPFKDYILETADAVDVGATSFVLPHAPMTTAYNFVFDNKYKSKVEYDYDALGYLTSSKITNGMSSSVITDANHNHVLAKFSNAKYSASEVGNECSFLSFESGSNSDQWGLSATSNSTDAHTGSVSRLQAGGVTFGPTKDFRPDNQYQKYKFSCWIKTSANYPSSGGKLIIHSKHDDNNQTAYPNVTGNWIEVPFGNTNNKWKYFEAVIDLGAVRNLANMATTDPALRIRCYTVNDNATNSFLIDDIRFQPVLSSCISYTYNDFYKTSESDNNSLPTYIEYDAFNRPAWVYDQDRNIIKHFDYGVGTSLTSNYSITDNILVAGASASSILNQSLTPQQCRRTTTYADGLGRPLQTIAKQQSPGLYDIVSPHAYDEFGRESKKYLSYVDASYDGLFKTNVLSNQAYFYQNAYAVEHTTSAFTQAIYEASPLNRILKQGNVGSTWQPNSSYTTSDHALKFRYQTNDENEVLKWGISGNNISAINIVSLIPYVWTPIFYPANTLFKTVSYDENGTESIEYKDLEGKLICKKTKVASSVNASGERITFDFTGPQNTNANPPSLPNEYYSSYYVYDGFGRLIYEISPATIHLLSQNNYGYFFSTDFIMFPSAEPFFNQNLYAYKYDARGRLIEKKIPGQTEWNYFVYNKIDQLVLSQTPKQNSDLEWTFSKYDALGRVVMTGTYNNGDPRENIQASVDNETILWEERSNGNGNILGYTDNTFPQSMIEQLTVNYYDDYDFDIQSRTYETDFTGVAATVRTFGLLTGNLTKIIMSPSDEHLLRVNYYDSRDRLIQQHKQQVNQSLDRISNLYDFAGQLLSSKRTYSHSNSDPKVIISNTFSYDHAGRRVNTYLKVDDDPQYVMSNRNYNALGQLIQKNLHFDPQTGDYMQSIDYRYNIRGWLTKINNAACYEDFDDNFGNDVFGEELYYDDITNISISNSSCPVPVPQFNGNISAMKWKAKGLESEPYDINQNMYVYRYDNLNRMTAGYYVASSPNFLNQDIFDRQINYFNEVVTYGASGNIMHLTRNGGDPETQSYDVMDDLSYTYAGYQAQKVEDAATPQLSYAGFTDGSNGGDDYTYDASGNLTNDANKDLTVNYNSLNLPYSEESFASGDYITSTYDAGGRKIHQELLTSTAVLNNFPPVVTDYVDGIEYEDNQLKQIMTEEGRVRPSTAADAIQGYKYDYFLKDHLGSVRAVLSHDALVRQYYATMETQNAQAEEALFYNIPTTRSSAPAGYPPDFSYSPNLKVSGLNAAQGKTIGHAKVLRILVGDSLSISAKYFFTDSLTSTSSTRTLSDILTQLGNIFLINPSVSVAGNEITARQQWASSTFTENSDVTSFLSSTFTNASSASPHTPQAYLIWLFYTDDFTFVPSMSGIKQVEAASRNQLGNLAISNLVAQEKGYCYIYVANESAVTVDFDNLSIIQSASHLVEINDYYPYGLLNPWLSVTPDVSIANNRKFQGKQLISDVNTSSDEFGWRQYDPLVARWHATDPAEQFANPYLAMGNTPTSFVDYDGAQGGSGGTSGTTDLEHSGYSYGSASDLGYNSGYDMYMAMHYGGGWGSGYMTSSGGTGLGIGADGKGVTFTRYGVTSGDGTVYGTWDAETASKIDGALANFALFRDYNYQIAQFPTTGEAAANADSYSGNRYRTGEGATVSANQSWAHSLSEIGFGMRLTGDLYGYAARGLNAATMRAIFNVARGVTGAGVVAGAVSGIIPVVTNPSSLGSWARASVQIGAMGLTGVPYVGIGLAVGVEVANEAGMFGLYNWADQYRIAAPSPFNPNFAVYHVHH